MEITNHFKRLTAIALSIVLLLSCSACEKSKQASQVADDSQMREQAYRAIVQSTVNRYGIIEQDEAYKSSAFDTEKTTGVMEALNVDITGDGKDELFLMYADKNVIKTHVYEYHNAQAIKAWSKDVDWCGIFNFNLYRSADYVWWVYHTSMYEPNDLVVYKDGKYTAAMDFGEPTSEELANTTVEGGTLFEVNSQMYEIFEKRLGITTYNDDVNDEHLLNVHCEGCLAATRTEELTDRWGITIPEPRLSAVEIIGNIKYYGDKSICKMTKEMALAYAEAIESEKRYAVPGKWYNNVSVYAILMDLAGDGMPLLLTVLADGSIEGNNVECYENRESLGVWTWNGHKAERYDFEADSDQGYVFGYDFFPKKKDSMIVVGDGLGLDVGSCSGYLHYNVSNAQITLSSHFMSYSAFVDYDDNTLARGQELPGVKAVKKEHNFVAPIEDLLEAGWVPHYFEGEYSSFYAIYIDGKMKKFAGEDDLNNYMENYYNIGRSDSYNVYGATTGGDGITTSNWNEADKLITSLKSYAKVAGKPFYSYEEVKSILTSSQLEAIAKEAAKKYDGKIGEIYRLSDDLYYIIIYVDDEFAGGVLVKNIKNGSEWKIITHSAEPMSEDALAGEVSKDAKISNIKIDYSKTDDGAEYLRQVLESIDGTVPNDAAKSEITSYAESYITASGTDDIKAKKNCANVTGKAIKDAVECAADAHSELAGVLEEEGVALNKTITVIIRIVCKKMDLQNPATITIDQSVADALGNADAILFEIGDNSHAVKISAEAIHALVGKYSAFGATICKTASGTYDITFTDSQGNAIDKLEHGITFAVPASGELCTIHAEYSEGTDNWGGQYDTASGTLSFETPYSGTYTVFEDSEEITDISQLSAEHQKAIRFMVSKGYFSLDGGKFNPDTSLTRYTFAETLVRMFFALDRSLDTTLTDVPKDSEYYPYVASGEQESIIEGYEDHTFRGNNEVLREEVMALCSRTLRERKGYVEPDDASSYLHFADNDMISDWALGEIALAVREGLIDDGGILDPQTQISRADSALILYRLFMLLYEVEPTAAAADSGSVIIWSFAIFAGVLVITLIALVTILIKRKKAQVTVSDDVNANDDIAEQ